MHCIIGSASQVKNEWTWAGEGGSFWATTKFTIGDQKVSLDTGSCPDIQDKDRVAVAGEIRNDTLTALAYRNLSRDVSGDSGFTICLLPGIFFVLVALAMAPVSAIAAILIVVLGALSIRRAIQIGSAIHAVESAA